MNDKLEWFFELVVSLAILLLPAFLSGFLFAYFAAVPPDLFFKFEHPNMLALAVTFTLFGLSAGGLIFLWWYDQHKNTLDMDIQKTERLCQRRIQSAETQYEHAEAERETAKRLTEEAKALYNNALKRAEIDSEAFLELERARLHNQMERRVSEALGSVKAKDKQYVESQKKILQQRASNNNLYASLHKERAMRKASFDLLKQVAEEAVDVRLDVRAVRNRIRHLGNAAYEAAQKNRSN